MADASDLGILQMGVAQVRKPRTGEVIGYVHTSPDAGGTRQAGDGAQFQRWFLFTGTDNLFELVPAPTDWAGLSLDAWQRKVGGAWNTGCRYIWARARIYLYGGAYNGWDWTTLPQESRFPLVQYPDVDTTGLQIDVTGGRVLDILQPDARQQLVPLGIAAAFPDDLKINTNEYWFTRPSFKPAGPLTTVTMTPGTGSAANLSELLRLAGSHWARGSAVSVVGCATYVGSALPSRL